MPRPYPARSREVLPPDPVFAAIKGIAASLLIYWVGVKMVDQPWNTDLRQSAHFLGWAACAVGSFVTGLSLKAGWQRAAFFGVMTLVVAVPFTLLGESVRVLHGMFGGLAEQAAGPENRDMLGKLAQGIPTKAEYEHFFAYRLLPPIFGVITLLCQAGIIMFRRRSDSYI